MTLFLCKVQNIYIFDIQKLTIIIYTIVRGFTMEKNKIIQDKKHIIFIDRLTDYHIKDNNSFKVTNKSDNNKKNVKKKNDK